MNSHQPFGVPLYIVALFVACLITLTGTGVTNYQNLKTLKQDNEWVDRAWNIKNRLKKISILIIELDSNLRGYFLSGEPAYLQPWDTAHEKLADEFVRLEKLVHDDPEKLKIFEQLRSLYNLKMNELEECVALYEKGRHEATIVRMNQGTEIMHSINMLDTILQNEESDALTKRQSDFFREYHEAMWSGILINGVAALTLVLFYRLISVSFRAQRLVEDKLKATNDNLENLVQTRTRQLSVLSRHLLNVSEEEKAKLARELHDELGASLTAIGMDITNVRDKLIQTDPALATQLQRARQTLSETVDLKRRIMENLRPSMLDHLGLAASIRHHCDELARISGLKFDVNMSEDFDDINPTWAIALFRITQEALNNVIKYAHAKRVNITLQRQSCGLWLQILDDGIGMDKETMEKPKAHGLLGMRERTLLLGGSFSVGQGKNKHGCAIEVFLPFSTA